MTKKAKTKLKVKRGAWFVPLRGSYLPASTEGWLLYIPYVAYLLIMFAVVKDNTETTLQAVVGITSFWLAGAAIMQLIAIHKS